MNIPIKAIRLTLGVLARDNEAKEWKRIFHQATITDAALSHLETVNDRLCKELEILWRQSKQQWFGRYAFSLANVWLEIDTAKIASNGHCEPLTCYMERDFPLNGTVALEDMGEHIVRCFRDVLPKYLNEVGRKVYQ